MNGGFFTEEMREGGSRVGFRVETFAGESGILSHIARATGSRVGKYRVDLASFESIGVAALERAVKSAEVILIDEIGKMELFSKRFQEAVLAALQSGKPVVATIMARSNAFADMLKSRPDVEIVEVTLANRDALVEDVVRRLRD